MPDRPKPVAGAPDSDEFYYIRDGVKDDTDLHMPILRAVDAPIDKSIMGPIREKYRAAWKLKQSMGDRAQWDPEKHPRGEAGRWTFSTSHAARTLHADHQERGRDHRCD